MKRSAAEGLLYQALETELGGIQVYETALKAVQNQDLAEEWSEYLDQTTEHRDKLLAVFEALGLDPQADVPARTILQHKAAGLVQAIEMAIERLEPAQAELVAGECVVEAEAKDHLNWMLLEHIVEEGPKEYADALRDAVEEVIDEENEHFLHTHGWTRELWMKHLGFAAALPPPEEERSVKTLIGAGRAENARDDYLS